MTEPSAFDRAPEPIPLDRSIALDRGTAREYDEDGRLRVKLTPISKAAVNPYYGREIPNNEGLGLDPNRIYYLLRDPEELKRGAPTFNGVPLLETHRGVSADSPSKELVVGTIGTDAKFDDPYIRATLIVWDGSAIERIQNGEKRQLSSGYRYEADMTPGTFNGTHYDGVMRNIRGNHVALVEVGRAGPDVIVGDHGMADKDSAALESRVRELMAADEHIGFAELVKKLVGEGHSEEDAKKIAYKIGEEKYGKAGMAEKAKEGRAHDSAANPAQKGKPMGVASREARVTARLDALKPFLAQDADLEKLRLALDAEEKDDKDKDKPAEDDETEEEKAAREEAERKAEEEKKAEDKKAMDAAIKMAVDKASADTEARTIARMQAVAEAQRLVRPVVGDVHGVTTPEAVFKYALDEMKVDITDMPESAYRGMFKLAVDKSRTPNATLGMDAAAVADLNNRYGVSTPRKL